MSTLTYEILLAAEHETGELAEIMGALAARLGSISGAAKRAQLQWAAIADQHYADAF